MKLVEINWNPSDRQLRQFGGIALLALPALSWFWSGGNWIVTGWLGALGMATALAGLIFPRSLKLLFVGLTLITIPIGIVVSELALLAMYCLVFVPIGLAFRLAGRDSLQRELGRTSSSYWQPKRKCSGVASYFRQS